MKRNIILFSVLATLALSACGGKKTAEESKQAKLDALKKEIAKLQSEASLLEKELNKQAGNSNGKAVEITKIETIDDCKLKVEAKNIGYYNMFKDESKFDIRDLLDLTVSVEIGRAHV